MKIVCFTAFIFISFLINPVKAFDNNNCISSQLEGIEVAELRHLTMSDSKQTPEIKFERIYSEDGNRSQDRVIVNGKTGPWYDIAVSLNSQGNNYAYTALKDDKLIPVINGIEQKNFSLKVDTNCCGEGGHWFEIWEIKGYAFSEDGSRVAYIQSESGETKLILDGKVVDQLPIKGRLNFSPSGNKLAYLVVEPVYPPADLFLVVNGEKIRRFDLNEGTSLIPQKAAITSFNDSEIIARGFINGVLTQVNCDISNLPKW